MTRFLEAILTAVIPVVAFGTFLFLFHRINRARPARRVVVAAAAVDSDFDPPTLQEVEIMKGALKINVDVDSCPRCKKEHQDLEFDRFGGNPIGGFTHHAVCPDTKAPILIRLGVVHDSYVPPPAVKQACDAVPLPSGGACARKPVG